MILAPIVLFVYNRPWHTRQTLEALRKNVLADQSTLYVYADGPKQQSSDEDLEKIKEVRSIVREKKWCREVVVIESRENRGLADSILNGVTEVVNKHRRAIVLEDDIVTSPGFLQYMNDALDCYADEEKVMHVSAYSPPTRKKLPELFFYEVMHCWGWGTWKRAWNQLNQSYKDILDALTDRKQLSHFDLENSRMFLPQLRDNIRGVSHTWAILWYGSIYLANGLCLNPGTSLIQNFGLDGSGENCLASENRWETISSQEVHEIEIKASIKTRKEIAYYYKYSGNSLMGYYINKYKGKAYRRYLQKSVKV